MGRIGSFHDCFDLSIKSAEACNSGGGGKERSWGGSEFMESGGALLESSLCAEKSRWWEEGRNDCLKLLQKLGVCGSKATIGPNQSWLVRDIADGEPWH